MQENNQNAKILVQAFAQLASGLVDVDKNGNGKWGIGEVWKVIKLFVRRVNQMSKTWRGALSEVNQLTATQKKDIAHEFKLHFNIQDKDMEDVVETWLDTIVKLYEAIEKTKQVQK